jgi:hypothetical protein
MAQRCGETVANRLVSADEKASETQTDSVTFNTIEIGKFQIDCRLRVFATGVPKMQKPRMQPGLLLSRAKGLALSSGPMIWGTNQDVKSVIMCGQVAASKAQCYVQAL